VELAVAAPVFEPVVVPVPESEPVDVVSAVPVPVDVVPPVPVPVDVEVNVEVEAPAPPSTVGFGMSKMASHARPPAAPAIAAANPKALSARRCRMTGFGR